MNQELIKYIQQALSQGDTKENITTALKTGGWSEGDVERAFRDVEGAVVKPTEVKQEEVLQEQPVEKKRGFFCKLLHVLKWFVIVLVGLGVFLYFLPNILGLFFRDIPPIDDSDLRLPTIMMPAEEDNAYFDLVTKDEETGLMNKPKIVFTFASSSTEEDLKSMVNGFKPWDERVVEEFVLQNIEAFEKLAEAANKPFYWDPNVANLENITLEESSEVILPPLTKFRNYGYICAVHTHYLTNQGKDKEAMEESFNILKLGQKFQNPQGPYILYVVSLSMKEIGLRTVQNIITQTTLNNTELIEYARELNVFYDNEEGFVSAIKLESYLWPTLLIDSIKKKDPFVEKEVGSFLVKVARKSFYFHPNEIKILYAELTRCTIKSSEDCSSHVEKNLNDKQSLFTPEMMGAPSLKFFITENSVGKVLFTTMAASFSSLRAKMINERNVVAQTQAILALKAYKNDTGNLPTTLDELVPKYMPATYIEEVGKDALKYVPEKKIIYTVGQDGVDDGGDLEKDDVYQIAF